MDFLFSNGFGVVTDPNQLRALNAYEIQQMQVANLVRMQQAKMRPNLDWANYFSSLGRSIPEKPLDERFADFKLRLAAAIERRAKDK